MSASTIQHSNIYNTGTITRGGWMQGRISHAPSVYGGAGGFGTRISQSQSSYFCSSGSLTSYGQTMVIKDGKLTMQNLNDRLASYLETVRSLEAKNRELKLNISEFCVQKIDVSKDLSRYFSSISDLRAEIARGCSDNERILLQIDNNKMAADEFKMRYEMELNLRNTVEADILRLQGIRDSLTINISDLELNIEGLTEELVCMRNNHKEEMHQLQTQQAGTVNVEVDSPDSTDLTKVLEEMREQYETLMKNNKLELEKWYQSKVEYLQTQIITCTTDVKTFSMELSQLKKTYQTLEINRQSAYIKIQCLQQNVAEVKHQYAVKLSQFQVTITMLEDRLQQLSVSLEQLQENYSLLLEFKMRLENEIAEYRRLLEGEQYEQTRTVIISKVTEEVEVQKPHIEKRVKTIVEEIVDGKVVSSSIDTQVQTLQ